MQLKSAVRHCQAGYKTRGCCSSSLDFWPDHQMGYLDPLVQNKGCHLSGSNQEALVGCEGTLSSTFLIGISDNQTIYNIMRYQITNNVKSSQQPAYNIETQRDIEILLLTGVWSTEVCLDFISCGETLRNIFRKQTGVRPCQ